MALKFARFCQNTNTWRFGAWWHVKFHYDPSENLPSACDSCPVCIEQNKEEAGILTELNKIGNEND